MISTYLGHGTLRGRRPERRGRLPKRLRDTDGVATVLNTALNTLGAIADSGFKTGQRILWIRCRSLYDQTLGEPEDVGEGTAYTAVTPTLWDWMICDQVMLRHGVRKMGLPGNARHIVSVDMS